MILERLSADNYSCQELLSTGPSLVMVFQSDQLTAQINSASEILGLTGGLFVIRSKNAALRGYQEGSIIQQQVRYWPMRWIWATY